MCPERRRGRAASARPARAPSFQRDLSATVEERSFEVGAPDHGRRLDIFLAERMRWRSRARIQELVAAGRVAIRPPLDAVAARPDVLRPGARLRRGEMVTVWLDTAHVDAAGAAPAARKDAVDVAVKGAAGASATGPIDWSELEIVFEDERLLAVSKPGGINIYPTRRHLGGSLTELVHRRHRALGAGGSPPSPCHRLDRETTGVVLYAKDRAARAEIGRQLEERTVEKTYLALVAGAPRDDRGTIDLPLGRDLRSRVEIRQGVRLDGGGASAVTRWRVLARFESGAAPPAPRGAFALLALRPETGRQHQLRAHLAAIGHPVLGDKLYLGGDALFLASLERELDPGERRALGGKEGLALHAWRLEIDHPGTGGRVAIVATPPAGWHRCPEVARSLRELGKLIAGGEDSAAAATIPRR